MYRIMNRDLDAYSLTSTDFQRIEKQYDGYKGYHLNKDSYLYGDVLVKDKRVWSGFTIKFAFDFRHWIWKPQVSFKYSQYIHWLCFRFWFEKNYAEVFDKVIKDHLGDSNGS